MGNCLFEGRACLTLWPSRWVLIREGGGGVGAFYNVGAYLPNF